MSKLPPEKNLLIEAEYLRRNPHIGRAPSTLSERIREEWNEREWPGQKMLEWADEVEALEAERDEWAKRAKYAEAFLDSCIDVAELSPVDKLNQGYERAGLSSALIVHNKYGKHSAFGYQGRE